METFRKCYCKFCPKKWGASAEYNGECVKNFNFDN